MLAPGECRDRLGSLGWDGGNEFEMPERDVWMTANDRHQNPSEAYWYNLKTGEVEKGFKTPSVDRA